MKKNYILTFLMSMTFIISQAQTDINFDASSTAGTTDPAGWIGYMNFFEKPANGGAYIGGSAWGVADLVALLDTGANTVTLKPNRIGDTAEYWQTDGVLEGNKVMDASMYIQDDNLAGTAFTFNGNVISNTLNNTGLSVPFVYTAFIKVFAADYSSFTAYTYDLSAGNFTISLAANQSSAGQHVQYGFEVIGVNINSRPEFDAAYDALGSIVVGENTLLSVDESSTSQFNVYPNPTINSWNVKSNQSIDSVHLFDVLGKMVMSLKPNSKEVSIGTSALQSGIYIAKINSINGSKTIKLIKQ